MRVNEDRCIDWVLRRLEALHGDVRAGLIKPEELPNKYPPDRRVEAICSVGPHSYAIEHTLIEPYDCFTWWSKKTEELDREVSGLLQEEKFSVGFDLLIPSDWCERLDDLHKKTFSAELSEIILKRRSSIEQTNYDEKPVLIGKISGIEIFAKRNGFEIEGIDLKPQLMRFSSLSLNARKKRLARALANKLPKLSAWSREAQCVLILENQDISLTGAHSVRPLIDDFFENEGTYRPEFIYFVTTALSEWRMYPFLEYGERVERDGSRRTIVHRILASELKSPLT